ncbi:MAG: biopolymer transporter ExbD [Gemmatimonadales bacterium]|nr:biopolymer transporter ExbD [Gemmatimonadales bacterium]
MILENNEDQEKGEFQVNMTPLIDVSLVLVVILLLLTPLAMESGIWFSQTPKQTADSTPLATLPLLDVKLLSESTVEVDGKELARGSLLKVLKPLMGEQKYRGIAIDCAGWITHGAFVNVLDQARLSGAPEIAVAGR